MKGNRETVAKPLRINGNAYSLVTETKAATMWKAVSPGGATFFEVWENRFTKRVSVAPSGSVTPCGQRIKPTNEDFGKWAFCYLSEKRALGKLNELQVVLLKKAA
jgi:hypothetical protein